MKTFEERKAMAQAVLEDSCLSLREGYAFLYNWIRFELALRQKAKANRAILKYGTRLDNEINVLDLRHELSDL